MRNNKDESQLQGKRKKKWPYEERKACLDDWLMYIRPEEIAKRRTEEAVGDASVIKQQNSDLVEEETGE